MASCEREALKNYISDYHKGQVQQRRPMQQLDVYDLDIDDTDFYTIDDVSEHNIDDAAQHYEQACQEKSATNQWLKVFMACLD